MTRGVAKAGFRRTKKWYRENAIAKYNKDLKSLVLGEDIKIIRPDFRGPSSGPVISVTGSKDDLLPQELATLKEPEHVIAAKLARRFEILDTITKSAIKGEIRSLIVSGPGGVGKSFQVEEALREADPKGERHLIIKGFSKATGLFVALHEYRHKNNVLIMDDADSIFYDDVALNVLKAVCDTNEKRTVSWMSQRALLDDNGMKLPKSFTFEGTVIFISNLDFDHLIAKGSRLSPHLQAMMSRSHYVNMEMKTRRHCLIRIRQVIRNGMLKHLALNGHEQEEVLKFIDDHLEELRELSLRTAIKVSGLRKAMPNDWMEMAKVSCLK